MEARANVAELSVLRACLSPLAPYKHSSIATTPFFLLLYSSFFAIRFFGKLHSQTRVTTSSNRNPLKYRHHANLRQDL